MADEAHVVENEAGDVDHKGKSQPGFLLVVFTSFSGRFILFVFWSFVVSRGLFSGRFLFFLWFFRFSECLRYSLIIVSHKTRCLLTRPRSPVRGTA